MMTKLATACHFNSLQLAIRFELFPNRHNQRRRKLPFRSNQYNLVNKARAFYCALDRLWRNVFAAGRLKQLFLAISYPEKSVFIDRSDIAGLEPAVFGKHRARLFRFVVITAHHVWSTN